MSRPFPVPRVIRRSNFAMRDVIIDFGVGIKRSVAVERVGQSTYVVSDELLDQQGIADRRLLKQTYRCRRDALLRFHMVVDDLTSLGGAIVQVIDYKKFYA